MNIDPHMVSVLSALSTIKRQIMQELDRFMAICWDRIGVPSPENQQQQHQQNGSSNGGGHSGRGPNAMSSIFTPGKCVPVIVFVIESVPVMAPWHEPGASDNQIADVGIIAGNVCGYTRCFVPSRIHLVIALPIM
jgi:hypothetical protein